MSAALVEKSLVVALSDKRRKEVNDLCTWSPTDSMHCITSRSDDDDFGDKDMSRSVEVNLSLFVQPPYVTLVTTSA